MAGYTAGAGIVIDGTWPFRIIEAHLGQMWLEVEVYGKPAPACSLKQAVHPVAGAMGFLGVIQKLLDEKNLGKNWQGVDAPYFCCLGSIHAGVWAGAVPERCDLALQVSFCPPDTPKTLLEEIQLIAAAFAGDNEFSITIQSGSLFTPAFSNPQNQMVRNLSCTY